MSGTDNGRRESSAPISSSTISAFPDAKSSRTAWDISPEAPAIKHKHPGEEIIYVLEGSLEYQVEGEPPTTVKAGEVFFVPAETIHAVKNVGSGNAAELATCVVEKVKPPVVLTE